MYIAGSAKDSLGLFEEMDKSLLLVPGLREVMNFSITSTPHRTRLLNSDQNLAQRLLAQKEHLTL